MPSPMKAARAFCLGDRYFWYATFWKNFCWNEQQAGKAVEVRQFSLLKELTCEKVCVGSFTCLYFASCGFKRAGLCSRRSPRTDRGASSGGAGPGICVDRGLSPLGWGAL